MGRPPKDMSWFCLSNVYMNDTKVSHIRREMKDLGELLWIRLLALASQQGHGVVHTSDGIAMPHEEFAERLRTTPELAQQFQGLTEYLGMTTRNSYGGIVLCNWDKWQADKYRLEKRNASAAEYERRKTAGEFGYDETGKPLGKRGKKQLSPQAQMRLARERQKGYEAGYDAGYTEAIETEEEREERLREMDIPM